MSDTVAFAVGDVVAAAVIFAALLGNRLTRTLRIPAPALMLAAAAIVAQVFPVLHHPPATAVEDLVSLALVLILIDGGMGIGWPAFRAAARPIALVGVIGTFLTAIGVALLAHWVLDLAWYEALLVATAVAPTDPAVVFSVLGEREVEGPSGTLLEGESGANDPVGIALMSSLLVAGGLSGGALGQVAGQFALQMVVGLAVGVVGARALLWSMRYIALPASGLYPLRTLAGALLLFGVATVAHGSGFLAVFVAGILLGEARAPYKREIEDFHSALASLGEIVAFGALGLTVDLDRLVQPDVWVPGLVIWAVLAVVVRPAALEPLLVRSGLTRPEKTFVMFAGLKGAVPILLGSLVVAEGVTHSHRLYGIVIVVVVLSVVVQGSLVPTVARMLRVPMREVEQSPWAVGVRLRDEPEGAVRLTVSRGAPADGARIRDLTQLPESAWVSLVVRGGSLVRVSGDTVLAPDDEVLLVGEPEDADLVRRLFERPG